MTLDKLLEKHDLTVYRLAQRTKGRLSRTQIYNLVNKELSRIEFETLDVLITETRKLTGAPITIQDILSYRG